MRYALALAVGLVSCFGGLDCARGDPGPFELRSTLVNAGTPAYRAGRAVALSYDGRVALVGSDSSSARVFAREADTWTQRAVLTDGGLASDGFGLAVALSADGTRAVIGAPFETCSAGSGCGGAYVFRWSGAAWSLESHLTPTGPLPSGDFGSAVAISGDGETVAVGAELWSCDRGPCGATFVFQSTAGTWSEAARLLPADGAGALFGSQVAVSFNGDRLFVAEALRDCPAVAQCGGVHVFQRTGASWEESQILEPGDPQSFGAFGFSLGLASDGNRLLGGAIDAACSQGEFCGAAYVFLRGENGWVEEAKLVASDAESFDLFGSSTALSADGTVAAVGADSLPCDVQATCDSTYIFGRRGTSWTQVQELLTPHQFRFASGASAALSGPGETLLIGSPGGNCELSLDCGIVQAYSMAAAVVPTLGVPGLAVLILLVGASGVFALSVRRNRA